MNKIIFTGLVLATIALSSCSTTYIHKYMTSDSSGLKGNVKAATDMYYNAYTDNQTGEEWQKGDLAVGESNTHQKKYFNEKGKHVKQEFLTHTKEIRAIYLLVWDEKGKTVLRDKYLRDGETIYVGEHSYPSKDSVIVSTHSGSDDIVNQRFHSKIDKKGRDISCKYYRFDDEGGIIDRADISSKYVSKNESEFLFKANRMKSHHFRYTYLELDKYGNWTKALRKDLIQPEDFIIEREIEYYD